MKRIIIAAAILGCFTCALIAANTFNQGDRVRAALFSPDGNYIAAVGDKGIIKLWAAWGKNNTEPVKIFTGHVGNVNSLAFSPDGNFILSGGDDKMIYLWETAGGNTLPAKSFYRLNPVLSRRVRSVAFMPDGKYIASTGDQKEINTWEVSSGRVDKAIQWPGDFMANCIDVSGDRIAAALEDGTVRVFSLSKPDKPVVLTGLANGPAMSVKFSPDGKKIAAGGSDGSAIIWDCATGKMIRAFKYHKSKVNSVAFSRDGKMLATASSDKRAAVWEIAAGAAPVKVFEGHDLGVNAVSFSFDGNYIATAGDDTTIRIWNISGGEKSAADAGAVTQAAKAPAQAGAVKKQGAMQASIDYSKKNMLVVIFGGVIVVLLIIIITAPRQQIPNIIHPRLSEDRDIYLKNRCVGLDIRGFTKADAETQKIWAKQLNSSLDRVLRRFQGYLLILMGDGALVCFLGTRQNPDVHIDFALQFKEETDKYGFKVKLSISEGDDLLKNVVIDGQKSVNCYGNSITRTARLLARGDSSADEIIIDKIAYDLYFCNAGNYRDKLIKDPATNKVVVNEAERKHEEEHELNYVIYKVWE